ncbi:MAG TPA: hypothetical protein VK427_03305 [Kofleriaceae bacterium]|nr:hypothetical protein [Kofleriaceae bacterium]
MVRLLLLVALLGTFACHNEPKPMTPKEGELPPLPPASGTAVGYLVDNASQLNLRDDQLEKLKAIDFSLAAKNDSIDTQLRTMERPDEVAPQKDQPPPRHNNAPGAQVTSSPGAQKLHQARRENDKEAIEKAFAVLDEKQQEIAKRLLDERGVALPGTKTGDKPRAESDGQPLPGMEP